MYLKTQSPITRFDAPLGGGGTSGGGGQGKGILFFCNRGGHNSSRSAADWAPWRRSTDQRRHAPWPLKKMKDGEGRRSGHPNHLRPAPWQRKMMAGEGSQSELNEGTAAPWPPRKMMAGEGRQSGVKERPAPWPPRKMMTGFVWSLERPASMTGGFHGCVTCKLNFCPAP